MAPCPRIDKADSAAGAGAESERVGANVSADALADSCPGEGRRAVKLPMIALAGRTVSAVRLRGVGRIAASAFAGAWFTRTGRRILTAALCRRVGRVRAGVWATARRTERGAGRGTGRAAVRAAVRLSGWEAVRWGGFRFLFKCRAAAWLRAGCLRGAAFVCPCANRSCEPRAAIRKRQACTRTVREVRRMRGSAENPEQSQCRPWGR